MKSKDKILSNSELLEDVSTINLISDEELEKLTKGAKVEEGMLVVGWEGAIFGYVTYKYWWANNGGLFYCYSTSYKILNKFGGMGHKSNLHFSFDSLQWWGNDSPDNLRSDDKWYPYAVGGWIGANKRARVYARFTFDLSLLPDPSVSSEIWMKYSAP
ncbi:hypothetical protein [Pseudomonas vancouverensis]|uniref:hypothetical protein n=1 Tax=Pseudomonas vancouverensis TaxID=95300 RepID=UPI00087BC127|nr:hypothetical protein [Pseudomonas vancouverensis]SDV14308.1 hypothetical protein SAMN05216558_4363 [Pseudomonas vancouverensis]